MGYIWERSLDISRYFTTEPFDILSIRLLPHTQSPDSGILLYFLLHLVHRTFCLENALLLPAISGRKCDMRTPSTTPLWSTALILSASFIRLSTSSFIVANILYRQSFGPL